MMPDPSAVAERLIQEMDGSDSIIELDEPIQPRIATGEYDAVCLSVVPIELTTWYRKALCFRFQIKQVGPAHDVILEGFVNLGEMENSKRKQPKTPAQMFKRKRETKLVKWWRILLTFDPTLSAKRIDPRVFKKYAYRILVSNVETDNRQQKVAPAGQYQKVDQIVSVVGKLGASR